MSSSTYSIDAACLLHEQGMPMWAHVDAYEDKLLQSLACGQQSALQVGHACSKHPLNHCCAVAASEVHASQHMQCVCSQCGLQGMGVGGGA